MIRVLLILAIVAAIAGLRLTAKQSSPLRLAFLAPSSAGAISGLSSIDRK